MSVSTGTLVAVAGPSGVGKSTVVRRLVTLDPSVWLSVSATTRSPRPGERDGIDYEFLSREAFEELRASGGFLESAEYAGNLYGTPRRSVDAHLQAGTNVLLEIEVQGVRLVKAAMPQCLTVFLAPPSWDVLEQRLRDRGTDDQAALIKRLAIAKDELAAQNEFDQVIINADVDDAAEQLLRLLDSRL